MQHFDTFDMLACCTDFGRSICAVSPARTEQIPTLPAAIYSATIYYSFTVIMLSLLYHPQLWPADLPSSLCEFRSVTAPAFLVTATLRCVAQRRPGPVRCRRRAPAWVGSAVPLRHRLSWPSVAFSGPAGHCAAESCALRQAGDWGHRLGRRTAGAAPRKNLCHRNWRRQRNQRRSI